MAFSLRYSSPLIPLVALLISGAACGACSSATETQDTARNVPGASESTSGDQSVAAGGNTAATTGSNPGAVESSTQDPLAQGGSNSGQTAVPSGEAHGLGQGGAFNVGTGETTNAAGAGGVSAISQDDQASGGSAGNNDAATLGLGGSGGSGSGDLGTGGVATGGFATGGTETGQTSASAGNGGANLGTAGDSAGGTGGSAAEVGGASGTGGSPTTDSAGCPIVLEGFASVNADGQDGTYGGRDGATVTVTTQQGLDQYATASEPYTIRVQGAITLSPKGTEIRVASDKTIIGVGTSGEIVEGGFFLAEGVHNVIIRNLTIRDTFVEGDWDGKENDFDGVQMDTAHHVWIDHCHFHHLGDGIIDSRKDTSYLTVSWSILSDHNKAFGIGWTDNVTAQMTIHHNWLRDLNQRNPSIDNVLRAHLYNNFLQRIDSYGNYARGATNLVLENSVFDTVKDPYYGDDGSLVASGNILRNTTGQQETFGAAFFNPADFYSYTLDPADEVEQLLDECAGPRPELGL